MQGSCKLSVLSLNLLVQVYLEELMHPDQLDGELNLAPGLLLLLIILLLLQWSLTIGQFT